MKLHIIGRLPPPFDGQTIATRRMVELVSNKHTVQRINTEPPSNDFVENQVKFRWSRVRHYLSMRSEIEQALSRWPAAPILWASISPAVLGHFRDVVSVAPAFQKNQPVVAVVHRSGYELLFRSSLTKSTAFWLEKRLSFYVFLTEGLSLECAPWIPERKRVVIPNTIDRAILFADAEIDQKRSDAVDRHVFRILFLSNMIPQKGYLDVLAAATALRNKNFDFEVDFVGRWGSDEDRRSFDDLVDEHRLQDMVNYHGGIEDRATIKECYRRADVFVLPTYHPTEAQPVALIEAMNAGLPIITTKQGDLSAMFAEDTALFVEPQDPAGIADRVLQLADRNTWMSYSERSRTNFEERFSEGRVREMWEALIDRLPAP